MPYTSTKLQAGKLRHRIEIVQPGIVQDDSGGVSLAATSPVVTVWAKIEAITGKDVLAANQFSSVVTHKITVRYNPNITFLAKMQVWFGGRQFQVESVLNPDETTKLLYLLCVEINDSQQQVTGQPAGLT